MSSPLEQSIVDLLRQSALGSVMDRPVNDVLRDMGLPGLPQLPPMPPLPELPPLPVLDLNALAKPITDLSSTFGSGNLGNIAGGVDPVQVLSQVTTVLQTVAQLSSTALQMASSLWQGQGAASAGGKAAQAASDTAAVSGQGTRMSLGSTAAAGSVFTGNMMMTGITAKFLASLAAAGPFLATPPGQAFMLGMTAETLSEALAVVAKTRAELTAHSAQMAQNGKKVPVTSVPKGVPKMSAKAISATTNSARSIASPAASQLGAANTMSTATSGAGNPAQYVTQALQLLQGLVSVGTTGAQTVAQVANTVGHAPISAAPIAGAHALGGGGPVGGGAVGGGAAVTGGGGGPAQTAMPLQEARTATIMSGGGAPGGMTTSSALPGATGGASSPGMMPYGPGATGGASRASGVTGDIRPELVTAEHGNEVIGPIDGVSVPVVGAADAVTATPDTDTDCPDKALTL